jgi:hypothetical protein
MITTKSNFISRHQLTSYFTLTYLITFLVFFSFILLNPSTPLQPWSPVWFFGIFSPTFAALIITWLSGGTPAIKHLLSGLTRWRVGIRWYFAAAFLILGPLAITLIYIGIGNPWLGPASGATLATMLRTIVFTFFSGPIA